MNFSLHEKNRSKIALTAQKLLRSHWSIFCAASESKILTVQKIDILNSIFVWKMFFKATIGAFDFYIIIFASVKRL
jgi:hypothetical protein